jgi:succinoglycan biosynthesis transport protein ExoP
VKHPAAKLMSDHDERRGAVGDTVTAAPSAGMLTTLNDTALSPAPVYPPPGYGPGGDPLAGGVDYMRAWHALRRCWIPATALGLLLSALAASAVWFLLPRGFEAVAWLRVRASASSFTGSGGFVDPTKYEQYRKTQVQLIKSPFVLTAALRRPGITNLSMLADEKDHISWLMKNIQVTAPMETEVIQVKLRGPDPDETAKIVNAVAQAYLVDVVNKEKTERLARRDLLEKKYRENMAEVRSRLETFNNLARSLGTADSAEVVTQRALLLDHLATLRSLLTQQQRDMAMIDGELAIYDARSRGEISPEEEEQKMIDAFVLQHPQVAEMVERAAMLEEVISYQADLSARGANDPAVRRMMAQRDDLSRRIEARVESLRPEIASQFHRESVRQTGPTSPSVLRKRREMLAAQIADTSKEFDQVAKDVTALGNANADLEARRNEIEQLQAVTNEIGAQLQSSDVDIAMPNRVELLEEARVPETEDRLFRWLLTTLAGLGGFAAGGGLILAFEYLRDRISSPDEVTQRLGLRVIGTVPKVSRSGKRPNTGLIAESVDGVRTVITQTGREAPKVILVTSAREHEGKTTFAAQLAASLARSGNRTLLLDGDLRHPNVHLALGLDLRAGMPELLRGEIGVDEAVQPTGVDGLFAITGGACDYASITALSKPDTAKVVKELRKSFDHVVIDAGPVLAFADVLLLGQLSDAAILVTMRDTSRMPQLDKAVTRLRSVGIRVIGTVVNGVSDAAPRQLYASPVGV